ncbi:MAG: YihY family inner membrane protein [Xanthomonadales bacterium]|nr:YihY family inner membrane protein [Xanthomonadales bacterium]
MPSSTSSVLDVQPRLSDLRRLVRHVWKHFSEDRCFEEAASLGYTSLLAIVPLLAVIFGIVAVFPVFSDWSNQLKSFLFSQFLPATGEQVGEYINTFLASASGLTLPGTIFLIITALLLMFRIEQAFNRIWRVDRSRSVMNRVVMYWAVLTLGPLLLGAAVALSVQKVVGPLALGDDASATWYRVGIFFLSWTVFSVMFLLVPNRRVRFRDALSGALLSAVLFELAKLGFVEYVKNANYTVIYGALATIPLFLFWLYLVWSVILLGASLAASLTTFADSERTRSAWPERQDFQLVFRLVGHLWQAQQSGGDLSDTQLLALEPLGNERRLQHLLHNLERAKIAARDEEGRWRLVRDLAEFNLSDLYCSGNYHLPVAGLDALVPELVQVNPAWDRAFLQAIQEVQQAGLARLNRPLRPMYRDDAVGLAQS